jgi:hypothetical protein
MPRRRKSPHYPPSLAILRRDAQPLWREIDGEPDPAKRAEAEHRRHRAEDALISMYLAHERRGRLSELDPDTLGICERIKTRNGGVFPRPRGGRPTEENSHLRMHVAVLDEIDRQTAEGRRNVTQAIRTVAERFLRTYEQVRAVYYRNDPEWLRAVAVQRKSTIRPTQTRATDLAVGTFLERPPRAPLSVSRCS